MSKNVIYYFSGTGNSKHAAVKIAKTLHDTTLYSMRCNPKEVAMDKAQTIVFIFPIYHWTMPVYVQEFIRNLQLNKEAYIYAIATCGMLNVNAFNDLEQILEAKGVHLSYKMKLESVASYVAGYEPMFNNAKRIQKEEKKLKNICKDIAEQIHTPKPSSNIGKELLRQIVLPSAKALPKKDYHFVISNDCIGCGTCEKLCNADNIRIIDKKPQFMHHCTQCMGGVVYCPKGAINYKDKTQTRTKYHHEGITLQSMLKEKEYIE